jgi:selenocysteine lyase/cysteine desulfurase
MESSLHQWTSKKANLQDHFNKFRQNIVGIDAKTVSNYGEQNIVYLDWTASGRLYEPIEQKLLHEFGPLVANTHTETTYTGTVMTLAYKKAKEIIKKHVNASSDDVLIFEGTGMTGAVNKFQRILGLKVPFQLKNNFHIPKEDLPVVFITHMEHHSNHTSWLETIADVEIIPPSENGLVCLENFATLLEKHKERKFKIASISSCSNVTGIKTPYYQIAELMHEHGGYCFVDFACSGPHVQIDMHPTDNPDAYLDAIFLSPHKFLGGPGTGGLLIFNKKLYNNPIPDNPGGGTVKWTNPWKEHQYLEEIEEREDGGTPGFLQAIKTALSFKLKEEMGVDLILQREKELVNMLFDELKNVEGLHILAGEHRERLGVFSFYIDNLHFNLGVKLLNDKFGIQTRGGCSCAGTYGHYLLNIDEFTSKEITSKIDFGDSTAKPGWIRLSIHPTTTNEELLFAIQAIKDMAQNHQEWSKDYLYIAPKNMFVHKNETNAINDYVEKCFN